MPPQFRRVSANVHEGLILTPLLTTYLYHAKFPSFDVHFTKEDNAPRVPDGWFHPSTHPLMTERQLYYYLDASGWQEEPREYMGTLSIVFGKAVHSFIQMCIGPKELGVAVPPPAGNCPVCGKVTGYRRGQCDEHGVVDEQTGSRGHMDGVLQLPELGIVGFEFKTSNMMKLQKRRDLDLAAFRETWPEYYAQVQDYMRISGLRMFVVWFLGLGYPWVTREFHIPYDPFFVAQLNQKYLNVRAARAAGIPPLPCCAPKSKEARACPALGCEIKRIS